MRNKDKLKILYEDKYLIIVSKPHNMLTISTDKEKENTLYNRVSLYVKKQHKSNKIFIVHRLDKDTSGIVVFAKSTLVKQQLQNNWDNVIRKYVALVEGKIEKSDIIKNYLAETKTLQTYITNDKKIGKLAITKYKPIKVENNSTLIDLEILTGRKNQIRVHMASIKHPIIGDKKYGSTKNPYRRLCLHAYYIEFMHPILKKIIIINDNNNLIYSINNVKRKKNIDK